MAEKRNIFLVGPMGAGKSTIGRQLAQQLNMEFYDSDQEIEKRTGADVGWVFDLEGEEGFRDREEKVINELTEKQGIVLATGGGSVKSRETRNRLSARGVVVYLETTIEKQLARTQRDKKRPLLHVETPPREVLEALANERNPLYEEIADVTIRTDDQSAKVVANQIIHMLESNSFWLYIHSSAGTVIKVDVALWRGLSLLSGNVVTQLPSHLVCLMNQLHSYR
ncbi:shikimate kinase 1 domain protein [Escherichia coli 90.0039]|nr:shikimate kinase 1 domain protein [Escherichia coli 90.0039]